jgi:hypothetical protein
LANIKKINEKVVDYTLTGIWAFIAGSVAFTTMSAIDVYHGLGVWKNWVGLGGNVAFLGGSILFLVGFYCDDVQPITHPPHLSNIVVEK